LIEPNHKLYTIGFTGKSAEQFFSLLKESKASRLIDIRINRTSQLAGFAKEQDLKFLVPELTNMDYVVREELAPTKDLLASYRKKEIAWDEFAENYQHLLKNRLVHNAFSLEDFSNSILLCSEKEPEKCHRTLLANALIEQFPSLEIINLI
jgi:uncharacterized protein YeaO (DUF488 family)